MKVVISQETVINLQLTTGEAKTLRDVLRCQWRITPDGSNKSKWISELWTMLIDTKTKEI